MATDVVMPQMGYDMTEGTVVRWIKHEGDEVRRGDVIAEIETDKATIEMEADASGVLRKIVVSEGVTVPVHQIIAYIGTADEAIPDVPADAPSATTTSVTPSPAPAATTSKEPPSEPTSAGARVSPVARQIADEQGIDTRLVTGSGPGGRITKNDVLNFAKQQAAASPTPAASKPAPAAQARAAPATPAPQVKDGRIELSRMGQAIARRTQQAKRDIPHYYVTVTVDMTRAMDFRRELNDSLGGQVRASVNDLIVKACAVTLGQFPMFNAVFKDDHLEVAPHINIGVAISLPDGLLVPAVMECERKSLVQIAQETKELGERARTGRLRQDEYTGGTFSVSNLGMYNVDGFAAIIVAPQSAVLAVGTVRPQPVVRDGEIVVRQMMQATLSADHRVSNGTDSALFIVEVQRLLENPVSLLAPDIS